MMKGALRSFLPSDFNCVSKSEKRKSMPSDSVPGPNSVGWYILEGYPWWPVFVCDATKLREDLHLLGSGHRKILKKARDFPRDYSVIYYFGSHDFGLVALKKPILKQWECEEKEKFLQGFPKNFVKKKTEMDALKDAIKEVEEYLAQPEDIRVPPCMVPSDLDPTLEPPPKMELPSEDEEEEGEGEGGDDQDGEEEEEEEEAPDGDDEEEAASEPSDEEDDDEDVGGKEVNEDSKKKSKKSKEKKKSAKKEKEKIEVKKSTSKKSSTKEAKKHQDVEKKESKKRTSTTADKKQTIEEKKKKVIKTEKKSDVKKEVTKAKDSNNTGAAEDLVIKLEKEIEWILENSQFEELTTRKVRKILEERLKMDLKDHKATIKASVTRVINAMNVDEEGSTMIKTEWETPIKSEANTKDKDEVKMITCKEKEPLIKEEKVKEIKPSPLKEETNVEAKLKKVAEKISNAKFDDEKLLEAIEELEKYETLDKEVLKSSPLLTCLVDLRAHHADDIGSAIGKLVTKWNCEDLVPKPFQLDDIVSMKKTLENEDTSHDEILQCLKQLSELPLRMSDMKKTGISLTVSNLRSHANDKVSLTAKNLRDTWKRRLSEQDRSESFQKLVKMRRLLEKKDQDQKLQETQLSILKKLSEMKLKAQVIIDTHIGVAVSKLRKSNNQKLAAAAKSLRNKWASEHRN